MGIFERILAKRERELNEVRAKQKKKKNQPSQERRKKYIYYTKWNVF